MKRLLLFLRLLLCVFLPGRETLSIRNDNEGGKRRLQQQERDVDGEAEGESRTAGCQSLFGWNDFIGSLGGRNYTGTARVGEIYSLDTPIFDNEFLEGSPTAVLRGSIVDDMAAKFATGTMAYTFYDGGDQLVVHFGVSSNPRKLMNPQGQYGIPIGGSGSWTNYQGFVFVQSETREYESPSVMNYTVCPLVE